MTATQQENYTLNTNELYIGLELSKHKWIIGGIVSLNKICVKTIERFDIASFLKVIKEYKERFKLQEDSVVHIVYESGLDGFSVYRLLSSQGFKVMQVDSASIEQNRRKRKAKSDKIDVKKLTNLLYGYHHGERDCLRAVQIPSETEEDLRRNHREYEQLQKEARQHENRIMSVLAVHGIKEEIRNIKRKGFGERIKGQAFKTPLGEKISDYAQESLEREYERYQLVRNQLLELKRKAQEFIKKNPDSKVTQQVKLLMRIKGLGFWGAWKLSTEWFGWREFKNRKEVGGAAGLTGVPHQSGESSRDQGISKAGNKRIRRLAVELAWFWLRYQPNSKMSQWFHERFVQGKRVRRIGIVALARKLLVTLWRYLSKGILPLDIELKVEKA